MQTVVKIIIIAWVIGLMGCAANRTTTWDNLGDMGRDMLGNWSAQALNDYCTEYDEC
jgi:hypothetical protein